MPMDVKQAYRQIAGIEQPNPMQETMFERLIASDVGLLLKAPTGTGKTEAIALPSLVDWRRRLFLILPARSLVDDQIERLERYCCRRSHTRRTALIVDTGAASIRWTWQNGTCVEQTHRHLYDADVIVTTLDKFLYRFFGFGEQRKAYVYPFRIHYGARRPLFCFDEAHSYDGVAFANFVHLVRALYTKGQDVVVMTATMPPEYANELGFLERLDFTAGKEGQVLREFYAPLRLAEGKRLEHVPSDDGGLVAQLTALAHEHYAPDKRTIVTVETVRDAVAVYDALLQTSLDETALLLYHGRLTNTRRQDVYARLKERENGRRPNDVCRDAKSRIVYAELKQHEKADEGYLLVTTSAIEVGCDLDAHTLITEICYPEQLIQRAGRCNRKGQTPNAQVIVVGESIRYFLRQLGREDEVAHVAYVEDLRAMSGQFLDADALSNHIRKQPQFDYRVEMIFQMLYEYVYEGRRENKGLHDKGLVITRSWEPSVTLTTNAVKLDNAVTVSMRTCATGDERTLSGDCRLFRYVYRDDGSHRRDLEEVGTRGGCAYFGDLVLEVPSKFFDPVRGYVERPRAFLARGGGYKRWLVFPTPEDRARLIAKGQGSRRLTGAWFWYLDGLPEMEEDTGSETNAD